MNFYNEEEKKEGAPAVPGMSGFKKTSAFGKSPMFSRTAGGILDRIKNLSRKDMAFVGIGLSVLVMAPVAEYMMSKPSADNLLTPGFGSREGSAASGLYEPGINALSQGSPDGSGEVITPLSSRDPASLILGSQSAAPAFTPPAAPVNNFRDAMKDAGRSAFSEATKSAGAPTPVPRMQSALRSFGSFFSGGEGTRTAGTLSGGKIIDDAKSASGKAAKRSMMGPVAMPGYKGVASNTPNSSSKGAYEKLRSAADKSAGNFSGGSAMNSLDKAAADALDIGKGAGGLGYGGESDKTTKPSGSTTKYDHNRSGETLDEMAAKQRMQKALDWEFYKQYEIPKQIINSLVGAVGGVLAQVVKDNMEHIFGLDRGAPERFCWSPANNLASTDPADCRKYGAIGESFLKDKGEKESTTTVPPGRSCACGFNSVKPTIGDPASGAVEVKPDPKPDPSSTQIVAVGSFDTALVTVLARVQEVVKKGDNISAKELLEFNKGLSGTLAEEMPKLVVTLNTSMQGVNKLAAGGITKLGNDSLRSLGPLMAAENETSAFITELSGVIDSKSTKVAKALGAEMSKNDEVKAEFDMTDNSALVADLKKYLGKAENIKNVRLLSARNHLNFNDKSQKLYAQQGQVLAAKIGGLRDRAAGISEITKKIASDSNAIKPEDADKNKDAICKQFADISGVALPACKGVAAPEKGKSVVEAAMALRGAQGVTNNALNDKAAVDAEVAAWEAASPMIKLNNDRIAQQADSMGDPQDNIAACLLRAENKLPPDVAALAGNPETSVASPSRAASADILEYRKALKLDGTPDNPPNTPVNPPTTPVTPVPVVDPALAGRKTSLLADARLTGSEYDAATAVHKKLGNGTNAQYARADYGKMTTSKAEIDRLAGELSAADVKPTKEKLDELEKHLGNFEKSYADFQRHAAAAGTPVPKPKPTTSQATQVIINNNVSAASSAGVTTKPTANVTHNTVNNTHNTVNNTTVKPPVVIVQPEKPKPAVAPKEFSVKMRNGTFMKLRTNDNTGASATYYGGYRDGVKWLYKYEVVCVRSGKTFVIDTNRVQRTKALFSTGITVGGPEAVSGFSGVCK
ncbi:MAG: hypothetical protein A2081_01555 [Elusimicrobia bacterium GWC2_61_19]|nr:MAG: hypothetical protein A2081_01555 [Elusimicrobia bacterium GWC2_61_19]